MIGENIQGIAIFGAICLFLLWRFLKFKKVKKMIPLLLKEGAILVDVRSAQEYSAGHHPSSINVPLSDLSTMSKRWDHGRPVILCCASGTRSGMAMGVLKKNGFRSVVNAGPWTNTLT